MLQRGMDTEFMREMCRTMYIVMRCRARKWASPRRCAISARRTAAGFGRQRIECAPTSLMDQLDRGETLEATGMYWLKMAKKHGNDASRVKQMRADARSSFQQSEAQQSEAIWQD